ncbi:MAG TPA: response regulator transcription factor [Rhodocyclaceae bacterium]|nr:response regulator transcription factor [Rhodocyclaceae bacterium]
MLIIASASTDRMARWKDGLGGTDEIAEVTEGSHLKSSLGKHTPQVLLLDLDFPGLGNPATAIPKLRQASPATKIVMIGKPASDELEISLFVAGVRGVCSNDAEREVMRRMVAVVRQGEPWIRRVLVPRLVDRLNNRTSADTARLFPEAGKPAELTRREQEIVTLVRNGESSKQIARRLDVSEPAVRAALTGMLRKIGIDERLKLALMLNISTES